MKSFKRYLEERYINLIHDDPEKDKYKHEVHAMLHKSYEKAGGLHGSGFESPDAMKKIPMWKLKKKDGKIVSAVFYKDKDGRKAVAAASDGSEHGKAGVADIMKNDLARNRSYGEKSKASLSFLKKHMGANEIKKHVVPYHQVKKHLDPDDEIRRPPADDPEVQRHPEFKNHFYQRKIGATGDAAWHTKLMLGHPGKKIEK